MLEWKTIFASVDTTVLQRASNRGCERTAPIVLMCRWGLPNLLRKRAIILSYSRCRIRGFKGHWIWEFVCFCRYILIGWREAYSARCLYVHVWRHNNVLYCIHRNGGPTAYAVDPSRCSSAMTTLRSRLPHTYVDEKRYIERLGDIDLRNSGIWKWTVRDWEDK